MSEKLDVKLIRTNNKMLLGLGTKSIVFYQIEERFELLNPSILSKIDFHSL